MSPIKRFSIDNAGRLFARNKQIEALLSSLHEELEQTPAEDCTFLLGRIAGIEENRNHLHRKLVESCVATKKEIKDSADFQDENVFFKGYLKGIVDLLEIDRSEFAEPVDFVWFIYSENEELLDKYRLTFSAIKGFSDFDGEGLRFYTSNIVEDICGRIQRLSEKAEYVVYVVYERDSLPSTETLQKLCFGKYHNVYLHKDRNEENIEDIVSKLLRDTVV